MNYVFALSGAAANLALKGSLKPGDPIEIEWPGCNLSNYAALAAAPYTGQDAALLDQSTSQVTVLVRAGSTADSFVLMGELTGQTLTNPATPEAGSGDIQAEIGLATRRSRPTARRSRSAFGAKRRDPQRLRSRRRMFRSRPQAARPRRSWPPIPRCRAASGRGERDVRVHLRPAGGRPAAFKLFDVEFDVEA